MKWVRALAIWFGLVAVESAHGVLRELLLAPIVGGFRARQIAVFTGSVLIVAIVTLTSRWLALGSTRERLAVGLSWMLLMLGFEIGLGHWAFHAPWPRIAADFDIAHGGLLSIGMAVLALSPVIAARLRLRLAGSATTAR